MHQDTGEIKEFGKLTKDELKSGKWSEIPRNLVGLLQGMNRKERREYLRKNGKRSGNKWAFAFPKP